MDRHESMRYWSARFFYIKDTKTPKSTRKLPPLKDGPSPKSPAGMPTPTSPTSRRSKRCLADLQAREFWVDKERSDLSWFTKWIRPLQHREQLMYLYSGHEDTIGATKDNLSCDALEKRLPVMIKVPREVHSHVCGTDIYT
jgi:hypothetical protein